MVNIDSSRQLLKARALSASIDAERKRRELEHERGRYMLAEQTLAVQARLVDEFVTGIEQSFEDLADMAGLTRAQLVMVRKWWREQRQKAAEKFGADAEMHPEFLEDPAP